MKQLPYECICCGFRTPRKHCMKRHLYDRQSTCPQSVNPIEMTDEIRECIMKNRVYHLPKEEPPPKTIIVENRVHHTSDKRPRQNNGGLRTSVRYALWNRDFGETNGTGQCACCKRVITQQSFHAGHIVPKVENGSNALSNLVPLCASCNTSMGSTNFYDFVAMYFAEQTEHEDCAVL